MKAEKSGISVKAGRIVEQSWWDVLCWWLKRAPLKGRRWEGIVINHKKGWGTPKEDFLNMIRRKNNKVRWL